MDYPECPHAPDSGGVGCKAANPLANTNLYIGPGLINGDMVWQGYSLKKPTGGRKRRYAKKRKHEYGRESSETKVAPRRLTFIRTRGGAEKQRLLQDNAVNLYDPKTRTSQKAKLEAVLENKANLHFARRNIVTKGAIIETSAGKARVTSRPGQEGSINAVKVG